MASRPSCLRPGSSRPRIPPGPSAAAPTPTSSRTSTTVTRCAGPAGRCASRSTGARAGRPGSPSLRPPSSSTAQCPRRRRESSRFPRRRTSSFSPRTSGSRTLSPACATCSTSRCSSPRRTPPRSRSSRAPGTWRGSGRRRGRSWNRCSWEAGRHRPSASGPAISWAPANRRCSRCTSRVGRRPSGRCRLGAQSAFRPAVDEPWRSKAKRSLRTLGNLSEVKSRHEDELGREGRQLRR